MLTKTHTVHEIPVANIIPNPNQPRRTFDAQTIRELADSIQENELLQPILVEDNLDGNYTLVGGERRWRAFQLLKRETIPANVRERTNHGGRELLVHALIENIQREDMNPIDEAEAYQRLAKDYGMTQVEIGQRVGKNLAIISNRLQLIKLDEEIRALIRAGKIVHDPNFVRALMRIPDKKMRIKVAERCAADRLNGQQSVHVAEKVSGTLGATRIELGNAKSPAMRLAQRRSSNDFDESNPPAHWNALKQAGKVPPWSVVAGAVTGACANCALASMASEATCGQCPLVDFLNRMVRAEKTA